MKERVVTKSCAYYDKAKREKKNKDKRLMRLRKERIHEVKLNEPVDLAMTPHAPAKISSKRQAHLHGYSGKFF